MVRFADQSIGTPPCSGPGKGKRVKQLRQYLGGDFAPLMTDHSFYFFAVPHRLP
jgi:hypothetical protein